MRADTEDHIRLESEPDRGGFPAVKLLLAVAVLAALLLFWFWSGQEKPEEAVVVATPEPVVKPVVVPAPDIPKRPEPVPVPETAPVSATVVDDVEPVEPTLPSPEESDELLLKQLDEAGADARLNSLVGSERPVEVSAALLDGMSRGIILRKILPADAPKKPFGVTTEGDAIYMSEAGYERYDGYADSIAAIDTDTVVESFHSLRPVYERAYQQLGLDPDDFDNAIIRTLDVILATPEIDGSIALERKSVMYTYADPELEKLSSMQKQLLRMGPDNIRRIKAQAQALRDGLLQPQN